jgi:hypothetical protein
MTVLGTKTGQNWTLLKVGIEAKAISSVIREIQLNLLTENGVPYYAHFYRDEELIIVFPDRAFHISPDENSWNEAVSYGESLGVPRAELDFGPCRIRDETF